MHMLYLHVIVSSARMRRVRHGAEVSDTLVVVVMAIATGVSGLRAVAAVGVRVL